MSHPYDSFEIPEHFRHYLYNSHLCWKYKFYFLTSVFGLYFFKPLNQFIYGVCLNFEMLGGEFIIPFFWLAYLWTNQNSLFSELTSAWKKNENSLKINYHALIHQISQRGKQLRNNNTTLIHNYVTAWITL